MEQGQEFSYKTLASIPSSDSDPEEESLQQFIASLSACADIDSGAPNSQEVEEEPVSSLIIRCAQAVARNDKHTALSFIASLRSRASPCGRGSQRLAHYFAEALAARITGACLQNCKQSSVHELINVYQYSAECTPVLGLSIFFVNQTILEHVKKFRRLHVVDYGIGHGFRWLCLLKDLSKLPGGPPHLRLTGVEVPQHYTSIVVPIQQTAAKLIAYAKHVGVPFTFNSVVSEDWDLVTPSQLGIQEPSVEDAAGDNEALIVTCIYRMRHLRDEPCIDDTPRKRLLKRIVEMKPMVFIQAEITLSCNCALELRVREAVEYYSGVFGSIEEVMAGYERREFVERMHGMDVMNMVACEGEERRERPECHKQWQILAGNSGLKPLKIKQHVYSKAVEMVQSYRGSFSVAKKCNWLLIHWRHYTLSAITAWSTK